MKFKRAELEGQVAIVHPEARETVEALDAWCQAEGMPEVTVTHVLRSADESEAIYWRAFMRDGRTERKARMMAREKFSWHRVACAVDLRNSVYSEQQLGRIMAFLKLNRPANDWELLSHDVGAGEHIHIGRRDWAWRQKWEAAELA